MCTLLWIGYRQERVGGGKGHNLNRTYKFYCKSFELSDILCVVVVVVCVEGA